MAKITYLFHDMSNADFSTLKLALILVSQINQAFAFVHYSKEIINEVLPISFIFTTPTSLFEAKSKCVAHNPKENNIKVILVSFFLKRCLLLNPINV